MDAVSDIKDRLSIEDVVSEYVQLKRAGRNFKGLSPFVSERTPSFVVSPEKQIWHDFSSGKGGDVFSFIMEVEGLDFKGALELLARKAGVELEEYRTSSQSSQKSSGQADQKKRLYEAVEHAVRFYQSHLIRTTEPLKYLREKRGYEKQTLLDFRFGYSPAGGQELTKYLQRKGFSPAELKRAGLSTLRSGTLQDMFRGRVMIPLLDPQGRPVGFTARQLQEDKRYPKYINTPATVLYDKGRQLFGLSQAKEAIRKSGYAVVVEGNLDVVASHQAGIKNVVASAGTALTAFHLKDLKRFTGDVRISFDDDRAGQEAAARTIPLAQSIGGIDLSIVSIPTGKDPDELIRENPKLWQSVVESPKYMVDWLIERLAHSLDLQSAQGKRILVEEILKIVRELKDTVEQEHYLQVLADLTNTSKQTITDKFMQKPLVQRRLKQVKTSKQDLLDEKEQRILEQHLLALSMKHQEIGKVLARVPLDVFSTPAHDAARYITEHPGISISGVSENADEYGKMLTLLYEEYYQHADEDELSYQARQLVSRLVHAYAKNKKSSLIVEMGNTSEKNQATLLLAVKQLDDLVVQFAAR